MRPTRLAAILGILGANVALAQEGVPSSQEAVLEEVIVTAQKRTESLQSVPIAITAVSGEDIAALGANGFESFATRVAGTQFLPVSPNNSQFFMRGVSSGATSFDQLQQSSAVGIYFDEVPTDVSGMNPNYQLFDMERIEVLRGPQGTLYGSGSESGAVRVIPRKADLDLFSIGGGLTVSSTEKGGTNRTLDGTVNAPLIAGKLGIRATGYSNHQAGYIDNVVAALKDSNDASMDGGRLALRAKPADPWTIDLLAVYQKTDQDDRNATSTAFSELKRGTLRPEKTADQDQLASAVIRYDAQAFSLTSVTGHQRKSEVYDQSLGGLLPLFGFGPTDFPVNFDTDLDVKTITQELRLQSNSPGKLQWIIGGFFARIERTLFQTIEVPGLDQAAPFLPPASVFGNPPDRVLNTDFATNNRQYAAFGELTYSFNDQVDLILGGRYFKARQRASFVDKGLFEGGIYTDDRKGSEDGFNPKVSVSYKLDKSHQVYLQAARGFRLGGPNYPIPPPLCAADLASIGYGSGEPRTFDSDNVWSYELGSKNTLHNGRATLNLSAFMLEWSDVQTTVTLSCGYYFQDNLGKARSRGAEAEFSAAIMPGLQFAVSLTYTDSEFREAIPSIGLDKGTRTAYAPKLSGNISADYSYEWREGRRFFISVDAQHVGQRNTTVTTVNNFALDSFTLANLRTGIRLGPWDAYLFANNLFDKRAEMFRGPSTLPLQPETSLVVARPRTVGVTVRRAL